MKKTMPIALLLMFFTVLPFNIFPQSNPLLSNSHDITTLPAWGPYSKRYAGISHVGDVGSGVRFDFSVMPGYYRNKQSVPHVLFESSYSPWEITPDLRRITYRHQLEWKDSVYVDVTFVTLDDGDVLVKCRCVNNTRLPQNLVLNNMAYIDFAESYPRLVARGTEGARWIGGVEYLFAEPAMPSPQYRLVYDGWFRFEERSGNSIDGSLLAQGFGRNPGDRVGYRIGAGDGSDRALAIRYRVAEGGEARFRVKGIPETTLLFRGTGDFETLRVTLPRNFRSDTFELISAGETPIEIDGFFIGSPGQIDSVSFERVPPDFTPKIAPGKGGQDFVLKYDLLNDYYGVAWNFPQSEIREVLNSELESFFRRKVHEHVARRLIGDGEGHYTNAFLRPVIVAPASEEIVYLLLTHGTIDRVNRSIARFHRQPQDFTDRAVRTGSSPERIVPEGREFLFGRQLLQASLLSNVVYPVYTQGQYIRHFTPGKNWNSLYTWDSGFISWGLVDIDPVKAFETLRAYTTEADAQSAFIHHGTPLPIQFFAFLDLCNRDLPTEELTFLYPRLRQFYSFIAGHEPTSTTRMKGSQLLRTWDYFYNSGGWDDYPPQQAIRGNREQYATVTPVVTTAYYIRAAKIMRMVAAKLGLKNDVKLYDKDIAAFSGGLNRYAWDEASGYFGYVVHDADQNPLGILRYRDSCNYNMGLDGTSPLVAGICTDNQRKRIIGHLFDPGEIWTEVGLSTVDRSAPYYKIDGYWNGAVWMPHQFTTFKALLDCGETDLAYRIARRALEVWQRECAATYNTFEHFIIASGRGAGWHQFSGLSSPVINWFASYFRIGSVTTGFEIMLSDQSFSNNFANYKATLTFDDSEKPHSRAVLLVMNSENTYRVFFNGRELPFESRYPGQIEITLPPVNKPGVLEVTAQ